MASAAAEMLAAGDAAAGRLLLADRLPNPDPTPGGPVPAVILCVFPIAFLVVVTVVKRLLLPTSISLPLAAAMLAFIRLAYLNSPALLVCASVMSGFLEALTPLSIITGAIMLFQSMQHTRCLPWMMGQIKSLSAGHPVAEIFLIGFAFAYLVEGASGFGTPVALAAPMLASLGHDPLLTVVCLLIMNTFATQFGAVGTPIWFGFGELGLGDANLRLVGLKAAIIVGVCTLFIAPLAASFLTPLRELARNGVFVVLAILTAVGPSIGISMFSYEFPSLIGGLVSVLLTAVLVKFKVGLRPPLPDVPCAVDSADSLVVVGSSSGGSGPSARRRASRRALVVQSHTFSFVDNVGVVSHPPAATLDFPLCNDPQTYKECQRHNFAAQVDEAMLSASQNGVDAAAPGHDTAAPGHDTAAPGHDTAAATAVAAAAAAGGRGLHPTSDAAAAHGSARWQSGSKDHEDMGALAKNTDLEHGSNDPYSAHSWVSAPAAFMHSSPSGMMELNPLDPVVAVKGHMSVRELLLRTMPITLTVLLLLLTRIPALPIKRVLQSPTPRFLLHLGTFGKFGISASLVVQLRELLSEPSVSWKYELLYVPFLIPFALASVITVIVHRRDLEVPWHTPFTEAFQRVKGIAVATLGALVLVQLIRTGKGDSPAFIIGFYLSAWLSQGFLAISAFLGALGSFFSGSTTVSNLTFGDIQKVAAESIGASVTGMLAVQVAGATIGNMICINNILSAKAVMNMASVPEGEFIRRTAPVAFLFLILAEALGLLFTLGKVLPDQPIADPY